MKGSHDTNNLFVEIDRHLLKNSCHSEKGVLGYFCDTDVPSFLATYPSVKLYFIIVPYKFHNLGRI